MSNRFSVYPVCNWTGRSIRPTSTGMVCQSLQVTIDSVAGNDTAWEAPTFAVVRRAPEVAQTSHGGPNLSTASKECLSVLSTSRRTLVAPGRGWERRK
ncbi:hypothetical protein BH20ACT24_BH20ACT24_03960 [soil metagenome]